MPRSAPPVGPLHRWSLVRWCAGLGIRYVVPAPYKIFVPGGGRVIQPSLTRGDEFRHIREPIGSAVVLCSLCCGPDTTRLKITTCERHGKMWRSATARSPRSYRTGWWCP